MKNIVLIGMPGTGKSTVGVILAKLLGYDFVDTDILISNREKRSLSQIIADEGYNRFIEIEGAAGASLSCERSVIATGGSMVFSDSAMKNLAENGIIVWLDTPVSVIEQRIWGNMEDRGVATTRKMTVAEIYADRQPLYERWAQLRLPCAGNTEQVVSQLRQSLTDYQKA